MSSQFLNPIFSVETLRFRLFENLQKLCSYHDLNSRHNSNDRSLMETPVVLNNFSFNMKEGELKSTAWDSTHAKAVLEECDC